MKNITMRLILIVAIIAMACGSGIPAYASSENSNEEILISDTEQTRSVNIHDDVWTTVISSNSGFNRVVHVSANTFTHINLMTTVSCDIRLLDRYDNVLWSADDAVPGNGTYKDFWCGSDVYKVQLRTAAGDGIASAY